MPAPIVAGLDPKVPPSHRDITNGMYWSLLVIEADHMLIPRLQNMAQKMTDVLPMRRDSHAQRKGPVASPAAAALTLFATSVGVLLYTSACSKKPP